MNGTTISTHAEVGAAGRPIRGPFTRWPGAADAGLAIVVFVATVFVSFEEPNDDLRLRVFSDVPISTYLVIAVASTSLYWRRYQPLVVLGLNLVPLLLPLGLGDDPFLIGFLFALYSVGRYVTNDRWSYYGVGGALAVVAIDGLTGANPAGDMVFAFFFVFAVWYIGRRMRFRGEHAAQVVREHAAEARRAVAEERTRIARELHDVVAHRVTLMTVQAGAAKTIAADDPEGALRAMEAVEQAGRQALGELRHLLGVLRPEADAYGLAPQPGLADVPRLVEDLVEAGLVVSLTIGDLPTDLPARVDLSAYRIVQEALTNVLKHAGPGARTEVRLGTDNHGVAIEVFDTGQGATILAESGHGIVGMRERALLLGGSLDAGPRSDAGFRVVAHLPIGDEPA